MLRHIVSWKLSTDDAGTRADNISTIRRALEALPAVIPEIRALTVGANVAYPLTNWDLVLIADFDDLAALEAYQVNPDHVAVTQIVGPLVSARSNVDFLL